MMTRRGLFKAILAIGAGLLASKLPGPQTTEAIQSIKIISPGSGYRPTPGIKTIPVLYGSPMDKLKNITAESLIDVQPLSCPTGQIFRLKRYDGTYYNE